MEAYNGAAGRKAGGMQEDKDIQSKEGYCYDDIIELPHHVSAGRPRMPVSARAAQFSPFAALAGFEEAIRKAGRNEEKSFP